MERRAYPEFALDLDVATVTSRDPDDDGEAITCWSTSARSSAMSHSIGLSSPSGEGLVDVQDARVRPASSVRVATNMSRVRQRSGELSRGRPARTGGRVRRPAAPRVCLPRPGSRTSHSWCRPEPPDAGPDRATLAQVGLMGPRTCESNRLRTPSPRSTSAMLLLRPAQVRASSAIRRRSARISGPQLLERVLVERPVTGTGDQRRVHALQPEGFLRAHLRATNRLRR